MENHKQIPTWIMFKVINFSTFIDMIRVSKTDVSHSLCSLYGLEDDDGYPNVKLLIGSLHWMRKIRNSCAHNERIYCLTRNQDPQRRTGRILEKYFRSLGRGYVRDLDQKIFDLIVYFKYFLPRSEYKQFISELKIMLSELENKIHPHAFEYIRGKMGIKDIRDLDMLLSFPKDEIEYNKFDK
jgi:abortive infection bacteriophage resistance protein